jgi:uncharacterized protein (UPF0332 family)
VNYQDLIDKGLLKKEKIDFEQINKVMEKARKKIISSKILAERGNDEDAYTLAYEAMLLAGRALVFSYGLRPRTVGSHKTVVEFTRRMVGDRYHTLVLKFDKMRKKRHYIIYGPLTDISHTEAQNAIENACEFLEKIKQEIEAKNPQLKLL